MCKCNSITTTTTQKYEECSCQKGECSDSAIGGAVIGAVLGGLCGGPVGALLGGAVGSGIGTGLCEESKAKQLESK